MHPNLSNKSFGVCASSGVLTLYKADLKALENAHRKLESFITLRTLPVIGFTFEVLTYEHLSS